MTEDSASNGEIDLFGHPMATIRDRRGRPSYKKTPENQRFVARRAADGWSHQAIALDLNVDEKTLRKNFSRELKDGALMMRGELLDLLWQRARQGHVPAIKALGDMYEKGQRKSLARRIAEPDGDAPAKTEEAVGKKEAARRAAAEKTAEDTGLWGGDLMPGKYDA